MSNKELAKDWKKVMKDVEEKSRFDVIIPGFYSSAEADPGLEGACCLDKFRPVFVIFQITFILLSNYWQRLGTSRRS